MVGTALDGQLRSSAARPRARPRFALATAGDDSAIRRLLRANPMRGSISLTFEREPDYFRGANLGGADDRTIVAFDDGRLICMGRCTTRECWINQRVGRVDYLAELRLDRSAPGRFDVLRGGYRFFHELHRHEPADFTFTSIAADNDRARRFLERGLPGLPRYEFLTGLTTVLVATKRSRAPAMILEPGTPGELAAFFNEAAARNHLSAAWTAHTLGSLANHNLPLESFGVVRERGRIIAAAALWDQRPFRQTVIRDYAPVLTLARPLLNAVGPLFGLPPLPPRGSVLSHAFLSPLALAPGSALALPNVIAAFSARAAQRGFEFLTLALPSDDVRLGAIKRRFRCRTYASRLYRVTWPGDAAPALDLRPILPDVSLL